MTGIHQTTAVSNAHRARISFATPSQFRKVTSHLQSSVVGHRSSGPVSAAYCVLLQQPTALPDCTAPLGLCNIPSTMHLRPVIEERQSEQGNLSPDPQDCFH